MSSSASDTNPYSSELSSRGPSGGSDVTATPAASSAPDSSAAGTQEANAEPELSVKK
jgi:hypothetical protein